MTAENKANLGMLVTDHVSAMLAYWDKDLVCRFANASYHEWFGRSKEEMIDKITLPELLGPLYELNRPYIEGALAGEVQLFERDIPISNGTRHTIANYYPYKEDGSVEGIIVHVADITPIKNLEQELVMKSAYVEEQNGRLMNFAHIVSHNLKNYSSNLELLLQLHATVQTEQEKKDIFEYLQQLAGSFKSTVGHLSEVMQIHKQAGLVEHDINVAEILDQVLNSIKGIIIGSNAHIETEITGTPVMHGDSSYMESILVNLLSNAIKYRHPLREPQIKVAITRRDHDLEIRVSDNGKGIDMSRHGRELFSMFGTFHGNKDANGVGLYITRNQVEAMKGTITAESIVDEGSTFIIVFPV